MLKSVNRLKKDSDFSAVFRGKKAVSTGPLQIFAIPNQLETTRVGVVISKKISKLAVRRNRIRRVLVDEASKLIYQGTGKTGQDIVVRLTKLPENLVDTAELRAQLRECFAKLPSN